MNIYKRLNDDINFDTYIRDVDSLLTTWLAKSGLKEKEKLQVRSAIGEMINGMSDGSFTYKLGGGYTNSKGITNAEDGEFDKYGIAAGYLGDILRKQEVYKSQDTQIENRSLMGDYIRKLLGGDNFNIDYFKNLDTDKTKNKSRTEALKKVLEQIRNSKEDNSIFTLYEDRDSWNKDYDSIKHIFDDNVITENEYLELGKLTGIDNLSDWFGIEEVKKEETPAKVPAAKTPATSAAPAKKSTGYSINLGLLEDYGKNPNTKIYLKDIVKIIAKLPSSNLKTLINDGISGKKLNEYFVFISAFNKVVPFSNNFIMRLAMDALIRKGVYKRGTYGNEYELGNNYYYNPQTYTLYLKLKEGGKIQKFYDGGIPHILEAMKNKRTPLSELPDYDPAKYTATYDTSTLVNPDMSDDNFDPWTTPGASKNPTRYKASEGNDRKYIEEIEKQPYYIQFFKDIADNSGNLTPLGKAYGRATDALLPKGYLNRIYDDNDALKESWTVTNLDTYGRKPKQTTYTKAGEYMYHRGNDQTKGPGHNIFLKKGKRYVRKDAEGNPHYVSPEDAQNYEISEKPVWRGWSDDGLTYWEDYLVTEPKAPLNDEVNEVGLPKPKDLSWLRDAAKNILPDIISGVRLPLSINANNKIANELSKSLRPALQNPYELYHRVTGDNATHQFYNELGNQSLRIPTTMFNTSDPHLALAGILEGQREANTLFEKGFLTDNAEIKRTQQEALSRIERNIKNRTDIANTNLASIIANNKERAYTEGIRLKKNWNSIDNFLQGIETRYRDQRDENNEMYKNFQTSIIYSNAQDWYNKVIAKADQEHANWIMTHPANEVWDRSSDYAAFKKEASSRMQDMVDAGLAKLYGIVGYERKYSDEDNALFIWK